MFPKLHFLILLVLLRILKFKRPMKIVFLSNTSWPHTGNHEQTLQIVAEEMVRQNHVVVILSNIAKCIMRRSGVLIQPLPVLPSDFTQTISNLRPDHVVVFHDQFKHWKTLLDNLDIIPGKKTIIPYGFSSTYSSTHLKSAFLQKSKQFNVICRHNKDFDYQFCVENKIYPIIIPECVDFKEFSESKVDFRKNNNISTKHVILCVSDFLPNKGQEHLLTILGQLERKDFTGVFITSSPHQSVSDKMMGQFADRIKRSRFESRFLVDIPREDIIDAYRSSTVFALSSVREHHPIVILEAMASGLPWISLNVGDCKELSGGTVITSEKDQKGYCAFNNQVYERFGKALNELMDDSELRKDL